MYSVCYQKSLNFTKGELTRALYGSKAAIYGQHNAKRHDEVTQSPAKEPRVLLPRQSLPNGLKLLKAEFPVLLYGVFCGQLPIKKGMRFGPYTGSIIYPEEMSTGHFQSDFLWEIFIEGRLRYWLDGTTSRRNWMKFVSCARHPAEQNLALIQQDCTLYYEATKDITEGEELRVWYGDRYSLFLGIPLGMESRQEDDSSYPCQSCGKVFAYEYYRERHLKYTRCVDHGDRMFPCTLCNRSFDKRDRLRIHILHVHEKHRPHQCEECGKRFTQSSSLNKHMRVHSGERPYKCPHCVKAFTASSILRTHIRQHSGEKPFKCQYCGRAFASHAAHDSHVRRSHIKNYVISGTGKKALDRIRP